MTVHALSTATCVVCGNDAEGNFSIHRDGFDLGPEVPLCDSCGEDDAVTCEDIWEHLGASHRVGEGERAK